ncbi:MAG: ATP-dependent DNA helicase [Emcibacter sp.]|nr:ATP-dependent DNA helicase [Emcibacter sp.]
MAEKLLNFPDPFEALSRLPALIIGQNHAIILSPDGEVMDYALKDLKKIVKDKAFLICNQTILARKLGKMTFRAFDILELFAFVRPTEFCLPLPFGLAKVLGLSLNKNNSLEDDALIILHSAQKLFHELKAENYPYGEGIEANARTMAEAGWPWGPLILGACHQDTKNQDYFVWNHLSEWEETPPRPDAGISPVDESSSLSRLSELLGSDAEERQNQKDYTILTTKAFIPLNTYDETRLILAEAGTGIGKTLGYIATASLWAEQNKGTVWLSTYTKNLQRQLDQELDRLYPDPLIKKQKVVIRKGRENYLCLLNLQERSHGAAQSQGKIFLGLVSRWARYSRDGDMVGGDFPSWLGEYFTHNRLSQLTDRRGECVFSACAHYKRCFVEKAIRKAKTADLVIANHALVMVQSATRAGEADLPSHYVFDEGHHIFDAADSAFSAHLTGQEGLELRRWIRGAEESSRRGKGLKGRVEDMISDDDDARHILEQTITAARILPADGWHYRISEDSAIGPMEKFLELVRKQVFARNKATHHFHSMETPAEYFIEGLQDAAKNLHHGLDDLGKFLKKLAVILLKKLDDETAELDSNMRSRLESVARSLNRRADVITDGWMPMLIPPAGQKSASFVDWFEVDRSSGREIDAGMYRHWIDPSLPFIETVVKPASGVIITSATLRDQLTNDINQDVEWHSAEIRTGAVHMINPPRRQSLKSPFNYQDQSRIFIINDMNKHDLDQLAAAYRELMIASGGGALGIFTAINRLREVHKRLISPLEEHNIPLYAQHIDPINVSALIDIFRELDNSCLLGTDAVRDGVDVPGTALRLCIFDKVPWPRPTLLHKARREKFGKQTYDDLITRLRLKQAYGRLIRRRSDKGVFIMLDGATPTRLLTAFPDDVIIERIGLSEAIQKTKEFLKDYRL